MFRLTILVGSLMLLVGCQKDEGLNLGSINGKVAYVDEWNIHKENIRGGAYKRITSNGDVHSWDWWCFCYLYSITYDFPIWSPDGSKLLFSEDNDYFVYQDGSRSLIPINNVKHISWSPDGNKLLLSKTDYASPYLEIVEFDSWNSINRFEGTFAFPRWSPKDNLIAYFFDGLKVLDMNSGEVSHLVDTTYTIGIFYSRTVNNPIEWSPKGDRIAYVKEDNSLAIISISDRSEEILYPASDNELDILGWTPDDQYLLAKIEMNYVTVINTSTGETERITEDIPFSDGDVYLY
ncbi:MAG: hypothetical protein HKN92_03980 [Chitinophagales bacterium]|nr:hypothetical protein [Chitinophagales bacterium]